MKKKQSVPVPPLPEGSLDEAASVAPVTEEHAMSAPAVSDTAGEGDHPQPDVRENVVVAEEASGTGSTLGETGGRVDAAETGAIKAGTVAGNTGAGASVMSASAPAVRKKAPAAVWLAIVLSLAALAGAAYTVWQSRLLGTASQEVRQELAQRLAASDGSLSEARVLIRQQQESIASMQGKIGALESQAASSSGQAAALEALYREFSRSRSDQVLAEVEQAINIAAQQLQLAGNVEAALIALQGAEARLATPDQAHLQPLRRALIKDIDELKSRATVDVSGLALKLEILMENVDSLPLAYAVTLAENLPSEQAKSGAYTFDYREPLVFIKAVSTDVWHEIRSLVRLERLDDSDPVLLAPAQSTYLRENVKIRLLTARLALLARDGRTFSSDLSQAHAWVVKFFDPNNEEVKRAVADLSALSQTAVKAEQFSLTESFAALRVLQARQAPVANDLR